jgi:hypothetical protein
MKKLAVLFMCFYCITPLCGQKYISKDGHIWFYSHTPMEDVEAHNRQVVSILEISTGDVGFSLLMKSFEFKTALMQEHFNENYIESDKYPKALFKGKIKDNSLVNYKKDGVYAVEVSGDLTIHGVTKLVTAKGTIEVKGKSITAKSKFVVTPKDFDIKIPSLVENKIAKEIEINVDVTYSEFKS